MEVDGRRVLSESNVVHASHQDGVVARDVTVVCGDVQAHRRVG